jgi:hypothetical protein
MTMRIGLVAPPWLPVPPLAYGGTEAVLDNLARGLKAAGHDVLLFTTGDSTCDVPRAWTYERSLGVGFPGSVAELRHVIAAYAEMHELDIVHDHTLADPLAHDAAGTFGPVRRPLLVVKFHNGLSRKQ